MTSIQPALSPPTTGVPDAPSPSCVPRVEITHSDPRTAIVTVVGSTSRSSTALLSRALHAALDASPSTLLVDLGRLDPAETVVRGVLRCAEERARSQQTHLQVLPVT